MPSCRSLNLRVLGSIPRRLTSISLVTLNDLCACRWRPPTGIEPEHTCSEPRIWCVYARHRRRATLHVTRKNHMPSTVRSISPDKVRAHRERLRKQGLRPVQVWVPDVRSKAFARTAHRQSLAVAKSPHAKDDQDFVDAISAWDDE